MAVRHEFEFTADIPFIKAALRRDLLWRGYVSAGVLLTLAVVMRFVNGHWEPLITTVFVGGATLIVWRFHKLLGTLAGRVFDLWSKQSPGAVIRYELGDDGFAVLAGSSRSDFKWQGLRQLWCYDDAWLLEIVKMQSVFFPPNRVPPAALEFIVERCRSSSVRVRQSA